MRVISSDSHYNEPADFYSAEHRIFGDVVPHLVQKEDGDYWCAGDFARPLSVMNRPGEWSRENTKNVRYEETEAWIDLNSRKDLSVLDGVYGEVLFPSGAMLHTIQNVKAKMACFDRYNNFAYKLEGFYQGILMVPDDPSVALSTVKNYALPNTVFLLPMYSPQFDLSGKEWGEVFSQISRQEAYCTFHAGTLSPSLRQPNPNSYQKSYVYKTSRLYFQAHELIAELIISKVFCENENLKVIISELGSSWIRYLFHRLEQGLLIYQEFQIPQSRLLEIFREQIFCTVQFDFPVISDATTEPLHAKNILFGTDFPHVESTYGRTREITDKILMQYGRSNSNSILHNNALRIFTKLSADVCN